MNQPVSTSPGHPFTPDLEPMLARNAQELPAGTGWRYEPKWDGFRVLVYKRAGEVLLMSRGARPLHRYFPEVVEAVAGVDAVEFVADGELVRIGAGGMDFDNLSMRIHPAGARIEKLARELPARIVFFDLLAWQGSDLRGLDAERRRLALETGLGPRLGAGLGLTACTVDVDLARNWIPGLGPAGLDGVVAKRCEQPYLAGEREWLKVKPRATCDCAVIGYRLIGPHRLVSLLLGLYGEDGRLHHAGNTSSLSAQASREAEAKLAPLATATAAVTGRQPDRVSRWSRNPTANWQPVRPELVVEVEYDHFQGGQRFRHAARLVRWRPDRDPSGCKLDQVSQAFGGDPLAALEEVIESGER